MFKFKVNDQNGNEFIVDNDTKEVQETFNNKDITELKKLVSKIDDILSLVEGKEELLKLVKKSVKKEDTETDPKSKDFDMDEIETLKADDSDEFETVEESEEIKDQRMFDFSDSKRSFGSIEKFNQFKDSSVDKQDEIAQAWANYYNKK